MWRVVFRIMALTTLSSAFVKWMVKPLGPFSREIGSTVSGMTDDVPISALLFDCDGVIVETEVRIH